MPASRTYRLCNAPLLGAGSYGQVAQAVRLEGSVATMVAIKIIKPQRLTRRLIQEVLNHMKLSGHPHIIKFEEVIRGEWGLGIVMECADAGSLLQHMLQRPHGRLTEPESRWYFQQLTIALDYCHKKNIGHRDLKLDNALLVKSPHHSLGVAHILKICDFGFAVANRTVVHSVVGTPNFMAPEVLGCNPASGAYNPKKADIWSLGVMLYTMIAGEHAFIIRRGDIEPNLDQLQQDRYLHTIMQQGCPGLPAGVSVSSDCLNLLDQLLDPRPGTRITTEGIMSHPWFLTDLPEGALEGNRMLLDQGRTVPHLQTEQEIKGIIEGALGWSAVAR